MTMFALRADDVGFFAEHGWYNTASTLDRAALAEAIDGVTRFYEGDRAHTLPPVIRGSSNWSPADGNILRLNEFIVQQCPAIARLVLAPAVGAAASALLGAKGVRVFSSTLVSKPPNLTGADGIVGWHADSAYWLTCTGRMITAWIPLDDCDEENGTLLMVDGSHRWDDADETVRALRQGRSFRGDSAAQVREAMSAVCDRLEIVPMTLRAGQVHFHDGRALHGSELNRSPTMRTAVVLELQDVENTYQPGADAKTGKPYVTNTDRVCRTLDGWPDYSDPFYCPLVWREGADQAASRSLDD